jgi:hypothetical protein
MLETPIRTPHRFRADARFLICRNRGKQLPDGGLRRGRSSFVILGEPMNGSTGQQLIHTEWEAFAICEKQGASYPREDSKIQGRLDS